MIKTQQRTAVLEREEKAESSSAMGEGEIRFEEGLWCIGLMRVAQGLQQRKVFQKNSVRLMV